MDDSGRPGLQVWTGRHVQLELVLDDGSKELLDLDVVPDSSADFENGFLGESTPLAQSILGKSTGSEVPYRVGDIVRVRVLNIWPNLRSQPKDLTERREETLRKAVEDSDRISTVIYASSMSNKWGDMDPSRLHEDPPAQDEDKKGG